MTAPAARAGGRPLRHAVVGVGANVFGMHRPALALPTVELVGVSDLNAEVGQRRADELGCPFFADHRRMLAVARPDVVVVMTPHPFHAAIAIDALEAGAHVLCEKPLAVHVGEADRMIDAAERAGRLLAVNLQFRHRPEVRAAKRLVSEGTLGEIQRIDVLATWTRAGVYYEVAPWRGTWKGEGGGVLMNQAPHNLDLLAHLAGMPARLVAWTRTRLHRIETEDTAHAMLEWADGALGSLHVSTAEADKGDRVEILGTAGRITLAHGTLTGELFEPDVRAHIRESREPFAAPAARPLAVELPDGGGDHAAVYRDLHAAILDGAPLMADGAQGRMSLELANAMTYSSRTGAAVELPLDRAVYANLLDDLRGNPHA
jgi:predicted dehydrogenase